MRLAVIALAGAWLALSPATSQAQKRQRDRITHEEIMASALRETDLYQVVRSLRPHFLQPPPGQRTLGAANIAAVALYVDDKKDVDVNALRTMAPSSVEEVRYLEPSASASRFGPLVNGGAILVKTVKAAKPKTDSTPPRQ